MNRVLIVGPISSPIVRRLELNLRNAGLDVYVASHGVGKFSAFNVIDLGALNSFFSYFNFFKINKIVKELQPDLVHAHVLNHYGLMCAFQRKPLIVALWGSEVMVAPKTGSWFKRILLRFINELIVFRCNAIHSSSQHVIDEAISLQKLAIKKSSAFYWGFPLMSLTPDKLKRVGLKLYDEFGFDEGDLIVFPRGVSDIYNPVETVRIIKGLQKLGVTNKILIFKGFSNENDHLAFKEAIIGLDVHYIDRLLSEDELFSIYSRSAFHFSIPKSDSLGGGVVEPAQLGSTPVLSNIEPYREYLKDSEGVLMKGFEEEDISIIAKLIMGKGSKKNTNEKYTMSGVISSFKMLYKKVLNKYD